MFAPPTAIYTHATGLSTCIFCMYIKCTIELIGIQIQCLASPSYPHKLLSIQIQYLVNPSCPHKLLSLSEYTNPVPGQSILSPQITELVGIQIQCLASLSYPNKLLS
jgi:hypothetical protein